MTNIPPLRRPCPDCNGTGAVVAPEWRDLKAGDPLPDTPEESGCAECDGSGQQLTEAGSYLLQELRKMGFVQVHDLERVTRPFARFVK